MTRRPSSSRCRTGDAVPVQLLVGWPGRLALLAVALGLVLMHHVVGAHQHTTSGTTASSPPSALPGVEPGPVPPTRHHDTDHGPSSVRTDSRGERPAAQEAHAGPAVASSAALLHHHPDGDGHDHAGSLLHMCVVALVGAAVLLLALVLAASWWRFPRRPAAHGGARWSAAPRAPPISSRLAELQVLRL